MSVWVLGSELLWVNHFSVILVADDDVVSCPVLSLNLNVVGC